MIRTTTLSVALLGLTLLAPSGATAAGETCQGVPATQVGAAGSGDLIGTEGPDVIVTNGAREVRALGGDDLVCITDRTSRVDAGAGDDVVHALEEALFGPHVQLGPGSDRFTGTSAVEAVWGGTKSGRQHSDLDRDVIDAGPRNREHGDYVVSGEPDAPNADEVRVVGGTVVFSGSPTAQTILAGGGSGHVELDSTGAGSVQIDTAVGTYTVDTVTAPLTGFDDVGLTDEAGPRYVTFRGSERSESLTMELTRNPAYDVEMGGGDDELVLETDRIHRRVTTFDGGEGRDQVAVIMPREQEVRLDLRRELLWTGATQREVPARVLGFEDAAVAARGVEITGTDRDNHLRFNACRAVVRARGGNDTVSTQSVITGDEVGCRASRARLVGGAGADVLKGTTGPDVLVGGRGRDFAIGGPGRDTCRAERTRRCEVRR